MDAVLGAILNYHLDKPDIPGDAAKQMDQTGLHYPGVTDILHAENRRDIC